MSAPETKASSPAPRSTTTRTAGSRSRRSAARGISSHISTETALRRSGWSKTNQPIPPSISTPMRPPIRRSLPSPDAGAGGAAPGSRHRGPRGPAGRRHRGAPARAGAQPLARRGVGRELRARAGRARDAPLRRVAPDEPSPLPRARARGGRAGGRVEPRLPTRSRDLLAGRARAPRRAGAALAAAPRGAGGGRALRLLAAPRTPGRVAQALRIGRVRGARAARPRRRLPRAPERTPAGARARRRVLPLAALVRGAALPA